MKSVLWMRACNHESGQETPRVKPFVYNYNGLPCYEQSLCQALNADSGRVEIRQFPDGETYLRVLDTQVPATAIVLADLHAPDAKFLPLAFLAECLRELGAKTIILVTPYLPYMRQDIRFHPGEGITSRYFAKLVSGLFDGLVTLDPHLHRYHSLDEIYGIPSRVAHADDLVAEWIATHVPAPVIVGPDEESEQWAGETAMRVGCPAMVLRKTRLGDREVQIDIPDLEQHRGRTPVLVDDIIATGHTMLETAQHLLDAGMPPPVCVGIHGIFADQAFNELQQGPIGRIVTGNSIPHATNGIALEAVVAAAAADLLEALRERG